MNLIFTALAILVGIIFITFPILSFWYGLKFGNKLSIDTLKLITKGAIVGGLILFLYMVSGIWDERNNGLQWFWALFITILWMCSLIMGSVFWSRLIVAPKIGGRASTFVTFLLSILIIGIVTYCSIWIADTAMVAY